MALVGSRRLRYHFDTISHPPPARHDEQGTTHRLNFVEESVLDETLMQQEGIIVDDVNVFGTRRTAACPSELGVRCGILRRV